MSIAVAIQHRLGAFALDVQFEVQGRLTALFGPSGCGKTTVINAVAGLLRPERARIAVAGDTLADTGAGVWCPPYRRGIGYVFQDARLFPHLTVRQNLRFGRWFTPKARRYADEPTVVAMLGVGALLDRRPSQLSGGEKQRVALGRALLQSPRLLLMDEPLAALDEERKHDVMPYIERLRDETGIPIIYVSHSPDEVARLATDVVLMEHGRQVANGTASDMLADLSRLGDAYRREAGSLLTLTVAGYDPATDLTTLAGAGLAARIPGAAGAPGEKLRLRIRAADVTIAVEEPRGLSALNVFSGEILRIAPRGHAGADVVLQVGDSHIVASLTQYSVAHLALQPGRRVHAIVKAMSVAQATRTPAELPPGARPPGAT